MPVKAYYDASIREFLEDDDQRILGVLTSQHHHALEQPQRWAWLEQLSVLKTALSQQLNGRIFLEFQVPRMGKRVDAVLVVAKTVLVLEFKVGAEDYSASGLRQVEDYALDLKNFHEGSHNVAIVPILVSTNAPDSETISIQFAKDLVASPVGTNSAGLGGLIAHISHSSSPHPTLNVGLWMDKGYKPTPTIIEAAQVLYRTHSVADISRYDADAKNLGDLSAAVTRIIDEARSSHTKVIAFVTGVPGSGKTLAGLNIATQRSDEHYDEHAVLLSGNGPLVDVLREALARDKAKREVISKTTAEREVRSFIQNIHHFRDQYVANNDIPIEKVVVFDEAQRAWTRKQTAAFMQRKRGQADFNMSEPEFLISVMDRHQDWCVVVCLVGGGQEINTGEGGITEWMSALDVRFPEWQVSVSPRISLPEYAPDDASTFLKSPRVRLDENLHLGVSMRSFRAETVSALIDHILDNRPEAAKNAFQTVQAVYPIHITRDLRTARAWLRRQARGNERFGLVASSGAQRLRPEGIYIKADIEPANWFLNDNRDVRSSFYLEDVATEFAVQGLELDWVGVCWDGDFYHDRGQWIHQVFKGTRWQSINDKSRRVYLKNAYRVLLTRGRQGLVIFVPKGDRLDHTRPPEFYDGTFDYLRSCGLPMLA